MDVKGPASLEEKLYDKGDFFNFAITKIEIFILNL